MSGSAPAGSYNVVKAAGAFYLQQCWGFHDRNASALLPIEGGVALWHYDTCLSLTMGLTTAWNLTGLFRHNKRQDLSLGLLLIFGTCQQ